MELFEREEDLADLTRRWEPAQSGSGCAVIVTGPVAVGKSSLLHEFTDRTARSGGLTLTAVASQAEGAIPLSVLAQLALSPALPAAEREALAGLAAAGRASAAAQYAEPTQHIESAQPVLSEQSEQAELSVPSEQSLAAAQEAQPLSPGAPGTSWGSGGGRLSPDGARIADRFCALLVDLAVRTPLAVVVDDVHHADPESLACLGYLVRRVRHARIMLVLGSSSHTEGPALDFHLDALRQPHVRVVTLSLLSRDGTAALLAARLGRAPADAVVDAAHQAGGGNPLLAGGLAEDLRHSGGGAEGAAGVRVGAAYARAVRDCVHRGGPRLLAAARAIAVAEAPERRPERLLGLDPQSAAAARVELEACGLLTVGGRFRLEAARAAVLADLDPRRRTDLHRRAAELAYAEGLPPVVIAEHLRLARMGRPDWALGVLREAAAQLLLDGQVALAVDSLRLAHDSAADPALRAGLRTALLRAEWQLNPSTAISHFDALLAALAAGQLAGADALTLSRALLWHGRDAEAASVLAGLDELPTVDPRTATELRITLPALASTYPSMLERVPADRTRPGRDALPSSTEARSRRDAATALRSVLRDGPSAEAADEAERILRGARLDAAGLEGSEAALLTLVYAEQAQRAVPWCDALIEQSSAIQAPFWQARLFAVRAEIALRLGDLRGAERNALTALELVPPAGWGVAIGAVVGTLVSALTAMGRDDEAARALTLPVPEAMLYSRFGLHYLHARGRFGLLTGDFDGALADFQHCGELMAGWDLDSVGLIPWRTDAAQVWLLLKQPDRARDLLEDQLSRATPATAPRVHGAALRVLADTHEPRQRPALLRQATDVLQNSGDDYQLALVLHDLSMSYHGLAEPRRARVIAHQAYGVATRCGAEPLSRVLEVMSGQPDVPAAPQNPSSALLSRAEQRVAELVVLGHTNREIAKRLYVTLSTVEQHLTRVFRKLDVTSRADMAIALTGRGEAQSA